MKVHYRSRLARTLLPRRYLAITLGSHVLTREGDLEDHVLRHERVHVEQWRRHGRLRFLARYLYCHFRYGYWDNPFEVEARRAESLSVSIFEGEIVPAHDLYSRRRADRSPLAATSPTPGSRGPC